MQAPKLYAGPGAPPAAAKHRAAPLPPPQLASAEAVANLLQSHGLPTAPAARAGAGAMAALSPAPQQGRAQAAAASAGAGAGPMAAQLPKQTPPAAAAGAGAGPMAALSPAPQQGRAQAAAAPHPLQTPPAAAVGAGAGPMAALSPAPQQGRAQAAAAPPAGAGAGTDAAQLAPRQALIDLLSRQSNNVIVGRGLVAAGGRVERTQQVMSLETLYPKYIPAKGIKIPPFLKANKLLKQIFTDRPIGISFCLLEIWGFDLNMHLRALKDAAPASYRLENLIAKVEAEFGQFYTFMLIEYTKRAPSKREVWAQNLRNCALALKAAFASIVADPHAKLLRAKLTAVLERLQLGAELISHTAAIELLCHYPLGNLMDYFPEARRLERGPEEQLAALVPFMRFINGSFSSNSLSLRKHRGAIEEALEALGKGPTKLELAKGLKSVLLGFFRDFSHEMESANDLDVDANDLDVEIFLLYRFYHDFLRILEFNILQPTHPGYLPFQVSVNRIQLNLPSALDLKPPKAEVEPQPPIVLTARENEALQVVRSFIEQRVNAFIESRLSPTGEEIELVVEFGTYKQLTLNRGFHDYPRLLALLDRCGPPFARFESALAALPSLREEILQGIKPFLEILDDRALEENRSQWIRFFQDCTMKESLLFCRLSMLLQDAETLKELHGGSADSFLIDPLADLLWLEGVKELANETIHKGKLKRHSEEANAPTAAPGETSAAAAESEAHSRDGIAPTASPGATLNAAADRGVHSKDEIAPTDPHGAAAAAAEVVSDEPAAAGAGAAPRAPSKRALRNRQKREAKQLSNLSPSATVSRPLRTSDEYDSRSFDFRRLRREEIVKRLEGWGFEVVHGGPHIKMEAESGLIVVIPNRDEQKKGTALSIGKAARAALDAGGS